jgi:S1-C subfamily serine protease
LVGDVIIAVNNTPVKDHASAMVQIKANDAGQPVKLTVLGETRKISLDKSVAGTCLTLSNCGEAGVQVQALKPSAALDMQGLTVGDIILSINGCLVIQHHHAISLIDASETTIDLVLASKMHSYRNAYVDPSNPNLVHVPRES